MSSRPVTHLARILFAGLALAGALGCDKIGLGKKDKESAAESDEDDAPKKKKAKASASAAASAEAAPSATAGASASASAAVDAGKGPAVTISAGTVNVGHACGAVPRVTDEELVHSQVALGEFSMDVYPYPNDPAKPPKTGVSRAEAESLCKADGKRLCSEIEWERACKGAANHTFEYGAQYDKKACEAPSVLLAGQREKCQSSFGTKDMHGLFFEWTSSPWGRGQSGLGTARGYSGQTNVVRERCASGQGRDPMKGFVDVGFRCCSGPENPAIVDLPISKQPVITEDARVDGDLITDLLRAMPSDHQTVKDSTVSFDKVWRWHPRDNEELLLARWVARPSDRSVPSHELVVFKLCGKTPSRVTRVRGPIEKIAAPREGSAREKLLVEIGTGSDKGNLELAYWYGSVDLKQPDFVKAGVLLPKDAKDDKKPKLKLPIGKLRPRK